MFSNLPITAMKEDNTALFALLASTLNQHKGDDKMMYAILLFIILVIVIVAFMAWKKERHEPEKNHSTDMGGILAAMAAANMAKPAHAHAEGGYLKDHIDHLYQNRELSDIKAKEYDIDKYIAEKTGWLALEQQKSIDNARLENKDQTHQILSAVTMQINDLKNQFTNDRMRDLEIRLSQKEQVEHTRSLFDQFFPRPVSVDAIYGQVPMPAAVNTFPRMNAGLAHGMPVVPTCG